MALLLNGSTGYLQHSAKVVSGFPFSMSVWVSRDVTSGDQWWIGQGQSNADRYSAAWHLASSEFKYISHRSPGSSNSTPKSTAPNASSTLKLAVVVFASATSRTIYFGDSTGVEGTTSRTDDTSTYDRTMVGAQKYNTETATGFTKGSVAEAHFFTGALTATDVADLIADTVKPEALTGWVDGWTFKDYEAGGVYTSIGGTRTMTAVGGVTASAQPHPITRIAMTPVSADIAASYSISATVSADLATTYSIQAIGEISSDLVAAYNVLNSVSANLVTAYNVAAATGSILSDIFINNTLNAPFTTETVHYTLWPNGRVGSLTGLTPVESSKALVSGRLAVSGLVLGNWRLEAVVRGATAADDAEYVQHFTVS